MKATNKKTIYGGIFILIFILFSLLGCGEKSAEDWYNNGNAHKQWGRYKEALEAFNKAIEIKPTYFAWLYKGNALRALGCLEQAITAYNKAIEIEPDYYQAYYNKGIALEELGRKKEAQKAFEKANKIKYNLLK